MLRPLLSEIHVPQMILWKARTVKQHLSGAKESVRLLGSLELKRFSNSNRSLKQGCCETASWLSRRISKIHQLLKMAKMSQTMKLRRQEESVFLNCENQFGNWINHPRYDGSLSPMMTWIYTVKKPDGDCFGNSPPALMWGVD